MKIKFTQNANRMKYFLFAISLTLFMGNELKAQVKFGQNSATVNANAIMELEHSSKGLLLPRVALTSTTSASPMTAHVAGMTVYNTATSGSGSTAVKPGYYYNNGTNWIRLVGSDELVLPSTALTSSTTPAGTAIGQMVYNTSNVAGPPAIPVGPTYWDGSNWVPVGADAAVGNEIVDSTLNGGLTRTGSGTSSSPYTLGLKTGSANNQTMVWDGSKWIVGAGGLVSTAIASSTSPAGRSVGEMVYNTNNIAGPPAIPVGPTYWDGTNWVPVGSASEPWYKVGTTTGATSNSDNLFSQGSVAIGGNSPNGSAQLDVSSTTKGFLPPRMTTAQRDLISNPATGLVVFNTTLNCYQVNFGTATTPKWNCLSNINPSSNGSADISAFDCSSGAVNGTLSTGISASGVTKTVVATVTEIGTYDISAISNGVSFRATGAFTSTGSQDIVLTAIGTPITSGSSSFTINTIPNCTFTVTVNDGSSNGTAVLNNFNCNTANAGDLTVGQAVSGVSQTITVDCVTAGSYSISATANGVTFSASGTLSVGNGQNIVLTASGTPLAAGFHAYTLNTNPGCSFSRNSVSTPIVNTLNCSGATITGSLLAGTPATGVFVSVPYIKGNGAAYNGQLVNSTGVTGLTASLAAGNLSNGGNGELIFSITGTPGNIGTTSFVLNFGGQTCTMSLNVNAGAAIATLDCNGSTPSGTLSSGEAASGVSQSIPYTGGNGGTYSAISISSGGVSGLTATSPAGYVNNGSGALVLTISGTPSASGTASFTVNFAGQSCSFTRTVSSAAATITGLTCSSATFSPSSFYANSAYSGSVQVPYTGGNGGTYTAGSGISSTGVTGLTATLQAGTLATGAGNLTYSISGTPSASGTATFALSFGGQTCNLTVTVSSLSGILPTNITLAQDQMHFIASIYDQNYLPYTAATGAASTTRPSNPDATNEAVTVDVQGTLTTTGVTIKIPVTATGSGTISSFSNTITIPSSLTEDGISRDVTLSWASQSYTSSTRTITANIRSVGGTLNALKLDINAGIGNNLLGILLGQIAYPYNNSGNTSNFSLRDIAGIPDKMFGLADNNSNTTTHMMIYLPVLAEDGNVWLNNNLGAHYSNINHSNFNISQQATSATDYLAYGSLFQWGRKPDGHELITFTSGTAGTAVNGTTATRTNAPTHALFITHTVSPFEWRTTQDGTLWASVSATNNPCPVGFRVPTDAEFNSMLNAASIINSSTAASSKLKFTLSGERVCFSGNFNTTGNTAYYWTGTPSSSTPTHSVYYAWSNGGGSTLSTGPSARAYGRPVRCIRN